MSVFAIIDTNVLVSALLSQHSDSATVKTVELIFTGQVIPVLNEEILTEYNDVLRRKKFNFSEELIDEVLSEIRLSGVLIKALPSNEKLKDIKDTPFYDTAVTFITNNPFLITGNIKHFPKKDFIVTPQQFIERIENLH